jgi:His-Xaa-Ser system protein HxsD
MTVQLLWTEEVGADSLQVSVDLAIYPLEVIFRVCYLFTDRCYLFLEHMPESNTVRVQFTRQADGTDLARIAGEFSNEMINQKVRMDVAVETVAIRELIVTQAFAEADLLDRSASEANYVDDPRGISQ